MRSLRVATAMLLVAAVSACSDVIPSTGPEDNGNPAPGATTPAFALVGGAGSAAAIKSRLFPDMCVDLVHNVPASGLMLETWPCDQKANQQFLWKTTGEIVPPASQALCVAGSLGPNGDAVGLLTCTGHQRWTATSAGEIKASNGRCMALSTATRANGTKVVVQTCNGATSQKWDNTATHGSPPPAPPPPSPPPPAPPPPGPLPPGIPVSPGQSIQAAVNANPGGTTFILKAGTHLRQSVIPKAGDSFIGEPGAVLDGQGASYAFGKGGPPYPSKVTIRGLKITGYTPPTQSGAIDAGGYAVNEGTTGWVIDNNEVSYNGEYGIRIGNSGQITNNNVHHNKRLNIGGGGNNTTIASNEIAFGNYLNAYNTNFEAGGTKFTQSDGLLLRNNYVHDNVGVGLHMDGNNINTVIESNRIDRNGSEGIAIEVSYKTTIRNNTVTNNGLSDPRNRYGWLWNAGIGVHASPNVEVYGNTLSGNYAGIVGIQQNRGSGTFGAWIVQNLYVHDNTVTQTTGASGIVQDMGDNAVFTSRNNRWVNNTYKVPGSNNAPFTWNNRWLTWTQWRSYGEDATGTLTP